MAFQFHRRGLVRFARVGGLLTILLGLIVPCGKALDERRTPTQYTHRVWNQEEGLLDPTVYSILQTRDGYLWLGTQDGLVRFDGQRFRPLQMHPDGQGQPILARSLYQDESGALWVGSIGYGLLKLFQHKQTWFNSRNGLPSDIVTCVVPNSHGALWVCTNQGLVDFNGQPGRRYTTADGLPSNKVSSTCRANDGTQWISTFDRGLARKQGDRFVPYSDKEFAPDSETRTLACTPQGDVWVGTNRGLYRIRDGKATWFTSRNGLADDSVLTLLPAKDGALWIGTQTGITRFYQGEWSTFHARDGLSHSTVFSLYMDREGSLWAGTKNGLDQFTDGRVTPYTTDEGMPSNNTGPVIEDARGALWIGTRDAGLAQFDGRHFQRITSANGLLDNNVKSLVSTAPGELWVGTSRGLNRVSNGIVTGSYTALSGLPGNEISSLFVDAGHQLWIGTDRGVALYRNNRFVIPQELAAVGREQIVALGGGRSTELFASTSSGRIYFLREGKVSSYTPPGPNRPIASYYPDIKAESLWMGTLGSGLLRLKHGDLEHVRVRDGLFDDQIYAIVPDDRNNLWFASSKGIFRVSEAELQELADGKRKKVVSIPFSTGQLRFECQPGVNPAAWRTRDGRLWFSTTNGLVVVDPNHLLPNTLPPPAQIETVFVNGLRHEPDSPLHLGPLQKNLEIRYAGLSFVSPEKVTFRYILEGYDKGWIEAGGRREAYYTNLPPGNFRFRVVAINSDGVWSTNGASLSFTIEPFLYQRRWFFPVLGLLIAALIWFGYQRRVHRLKQQFDLVINERSRIARELHDTLLQGLSGITMQLQALWTRLPQVSEEKRVLEGIIKDAGICLTEARRSLWGLRTHTNTSSGLSDKLERHARQTVAGHPIKLNLEISPVAIETSPEEEYQLLRIAQEAMTNAVRHAHPKMLTVRMEQRRRRELELAIRDDGRGFSTDVEHAQFGRYGLVGMRERAEEIGAKLSIHSARDFGTEVVISLRVSKEAAESGAEASTSVEQSPLGVTHE